MRIVSVEQSLLDLGNGVRQFENASRGGRFTPRPLRQVFGVDPILAASSTVRSMRFSSSRTLPAGIGFEPLERLVRKALELPTVLGA